MTDLPKSWAWSTVGEVADVVLGQSPPGSSYNTEGEGLPFFQGKAEFGELTPSVAKWTTEPRKLASEGDILVSVRAPVGPTNVAPTACAIGRGLAALRPKKVIGTRYLLWAMRGSVSRLASEATGTTFAAVSGSQLRNHRLPLPPLEEQERIIDAIEEHFSRLDAVEGSLSDGQTRLGLLRKSLLARAQAQRWPQIAVGELLTGIQAGKSFKTPGRRAEPDEWGVIKVSAMTWGDFDETANKAVLDVPQIDPDMEIESGDLLLSRANTSAYVGATVLVTSCRPKLLLSDKSMRLTVAEEVSKEWLRYALSSPQLRHQMSLLATGTSDSMRNISQAKVRALRIHVPPPAEQKEIARSIATGLAATHRLVNDLDLLTRRVGALRRSILSEAFSGRLVEQDPDDEPASVLLERIRSEHRATAVRPRQSAAKAIP